ncbi:plasmid mobilization relaxosome protein MobC [Chitinophagaceae bacterium 26-R-25]|nr:plasmid mobilization relaxosome protein MobC [Chitinophagaceae bacterium 26-R-25]
MVLIVPKYFPLMEANRIVENVLQNERQRSGHFKNNIRKPVRRAVFLSNKNWPKGQKHGSPLLPVVDKGRRKIRNSVVMEAEKKTKKKTGRPPKTNKKEVRACVRFSKLEYFILEQKAKKAGINVSTYLRQLAIKATITSRLSPEEITICRQLIGMASNINQVARVCHREGLYEAMQYFEQYRKAFDTILQKLKA